MRGQGISNNPSECQTCHGKLATCQGHFGHIRLALPYFTLGTLKVLLQFCRIFARTVRAT
ncbi:hypothetical protein V1525DRAFT_399688, partial [Lipomyces kononenkoae]